MKCVAPPMPTGSSGCPVGSRSRAPSPSRPWKATGPHGRVAQKSLDRELDPSARRNRHALDEARVGRGCVDRGEDCRVRKNGCRGAPETANASNRKGSCGFGGAEGDRTPDLMSAIRVPVSDPTFAVSFVFPRLRLSDSQGSHAPYKSQGRGNDHSSCGPRYGQRPERLAGRRSDRDRRRPSHPLDRRQRWLARPRSFALDARKLVLRSEGIATLRLVPSVIGLGLPSMPQRPVGTHGEQLQPTIVILSGRDAGR